MRGHRARARVRHRARARLLLLLALLPALLLTQTQQSYASTSLNADGSSWAGPALDQWRQDVGPQGIVINFTPIGSAAGRNQWELGQDDFTASDVPFRTSADAGAGSGATSGLGQPENPKYGYSYVPVTAGGTAFMYNLKVAGHQVNNLRLSPDTLVKIFTGQIQDWADPAITHDYGQQLPHLQITPVVRSDGSGATAQFTRWMEHTHQGEWDSYCRSVLGVACGDYTEFYPRSGHMLAQNGSDVVANFIQSPTGLGTIGYDEYAYALRASWPVVKVLNPAGYYSLPTAFNVAVALTAARIRGVDDNTSPNDPNYLQQNLDGVYTNTDPRSYPVSSYSYLIVPRGGAALPVPPRFDNNKGAALSQYLDYILCAGQGEAKDLGYSPIPRGLVRGGLLQVQHIPGQSGNVDPNTLRNCRNPTFNSAGVLTVLATAPQPSPCDKLGAPLTCTTGGSGGSGGGSGGSSGGAGGGSTGGASGGTTGGASGGTNGGATGGGTTIDPQTGQVVPAGSGGSGGNAGAVQAQAVELAGRQDDWTLTSLTGVELLAVVAAPPLVGTWLRRRRRLGVGGQGGTGGSGGTGGTGGAR